MTADTSLAPRLAVSAPRRLLRPGRVLGYLFLIALTAAMVFPLLWLVLTSLRPADDVFGAGLLPREISFDAYVRAWTQLDYPGHFLNSLGITLLTVLGVVALAALGGYSFAKLEFPFKEPIYVVLLVTLMLPATAIVVPLFLELRSLELLNTRQGLILVYIGTSLPFAMFLMRAFFETLPDELIQAARVDGCGEFAIFWRIMLPLARPGIATVVIFQFMHTWNEFLFAQTLLQTPSRHPLQPVLYSLVGEYSTDWTILAASLVMTIVPIVVVYVRMQRQFVAGLTLGAVKD
ncbi:carbohydrate ABC transporter permease [Amycolatopsis endophytica]|uniref:ABC-type glycerol-3-phosphate transport system permease component n=1 Tax=Amycolatopsis endophytica TaxID=860233 RepID=A0A853BBY3_9PSEU|nr:carbohydrate ABC transporter permease [Amycolatopsis endophytica]NYI92295.1 ABC-type glycerol-3-phosphate transport system permease component [Amycolatopsis endophytica]